MSIKRLVSMLLVIVMTASVLVPALSAAEPNEGTVLSTLATNGGTPAVALSSNVHSMDFGDPGLGDEGYQISIALTNVGINAVNMTAEVIHDGDRSLLSDTLTINDEDWKDYHHYLDSYARKDLSISVSAPSDTPSAGNLDGSVIIWVEPVAPLPGRTWSSFQGDLQHTGYYSGDAPDTNTLLWASEDIDCVPSSSVTIGEGKVFVYCFFNGDNAEVPDQGYIAALDLSTGELLWKEPTLVTNKYDSWATPVYHDGLVFTSGDTARYASTGEPAWPEGRCLADGTNGGPLVADGKVFIGNWDGRKYFAYDEKTGEQLWEYKVSGHYAQGSPSYNDGKVFLTSWGGSGGSDGGLYCVDADTGEHIWNNTQASRPALPNTPPGAKGYSLMGSASISDGYIYATKYNFYDDGELYCFRESDGTLLWNRTIQRTDSTPAVYDGKVYVTGGCFGYSPHQTYCFDAITGELVWSTTPDQDIGGWTCSVVVADGKVFVGREGSWDFDSMIFSYVKLFALDANTGDMIWEADNGGATVAIYGGVLFTAGMDGRIYAYGTA